MKDAVAGGDESDGGDDDFIAGSDTCGVNGSLESGGAAGKDSNVGSSGVCREVILKGFDPWSLRDPI